MSTNDDTSLNNATGKKPPVFDGDHRYLRWCRLVGLWMSSIKDSDKPRAASTLINAQTNDDVIDYMLEVPDEKLKTADGVALLIEKLNEYYAKDTAHLAWAAFYDFCVGGRKRGENAAEFTRQFKQRYAKVTAHDPECKISERMLSLVLLFQLGMSEQN